MNIYNISVSGQEHMTLKPSLIKNIDNLFFVYTEKETYDKLKAVL